MAGPGPQKKKGGKGAPKLKRSGRQRGKYAAQAIRTGRHKYHRILEHNGPEAAKAFLERDARRRGRKVPA